jgi:hypothetical protein
LYEGAPDIDSFDHQIDSAAPHESKGNELENHLLSISSKCTTVGKPTILNSVLCKMVRLATNYRSFFWAVISGSIVARKLWLGEAEWSEKSRQEGHFLVVRVLLD